MVYQQSREFSQQQSRGRVRHLAEHCRLKVILTVQVFISYENGFVADKHFCGLNILYIYTYNFIQFVLLNNYIVLLSVLVQNHLP